MKRILFFVHYNKYDGLSGHILYLLEHIKHIYSRIVFISNSLLSNDNYKKIALLCNTISIRENKGFDFGAWKDAVLKEGWDTLTQYDNVTLMNDTCFGPIFELEPVYTKMEQGKYDFWGLTRYCASINGMPGTNGPILEHIQSYFLCFNKNVVQSTVFQRFWDNVIYEDKIEKVIQNYETQFTSLLTQAGLTYTTLFDSPPSAHAMGHPDTSKNHPDLCINAHIPLVKIKAFLTFLHPKYIVNLIREKSTYPVSFIYDYFTEIHDPNTSIFICDKFIQSQGGVSSSLKTAIHLHVFYPDVFEQYIAILDNSSINFDLFITTDTLAKKNQIENYIHNHMSGKKLKEIIIVENRGRDILPWLSISDRLTPYDIVGHFHTKKAPSADEWVGITWQQELFDLLLRPASMNTIIETFGINKNIGIIIPDIPYSIMINNIYQFATETNIQIIMNQLWEKMLCKKEIDFCKLPTAIMPCGTMFWYRPFALLPLFNLKLSADDIPEEPIQNSGTILHSIERILVYIAWNEGYDFRIMTPERPHTSSFNANLVYNNLMSEYHNKMAEYHNMISEYTAIKNSESYRVGKIILALPRGIKYFYKMIKNQKLSRNK